jgi:hypothetical protein
MQKFIFIIICILFSLSCGTQDIFQPDYFIFGKYNFSCQKDCSKFVKYENNNLYLDNVIYLSEDIYFNSSTLPLTHLTRVKWLENNIPSFIKNYSSQDIGCPNCAKEDALYIETRKSGQIRKWRIEPNKLKISDISTQKYLDSLDKIIQTI